jgi:hypothetical protein
MNPSSSAPDADDVATRWRDTLRVVLCMLVPATADGRLPAAGELPEVLSHIERMQAELPGLRDGLDALQREAIARHGAAFAALDGATRSTLLDEFAAREPALLQRLVLETVTSYYQQDRVVEGLGMEARPPFPTGYQVIAGDLTLLKPVIARGRIYREVS